MAFNLFPVDLLNNVGAMLILSVMFGIMIGINVVENEKHNDS